MDFSQLTPKRIVIGVMLVIVFFFLYGGLRTVMKGSNSLGLTGSVSSFSAPMLAYRGESTLYAPPAPSMGIAQDAIGEEYAQKNAMDIMPVSPEPPSGTAKLVKNASLSLLVSNITAAADQITIIRTQFNGQPGNANFNEYVRGGRSGNITIWIPSEHFDEALAAIKKLALRVENENINVNDVSAQYVDLSSRLKNLHAAEAQYIEIMKRSGKISEVLDVTRELNSTRMQIEQIQGQLDYLSHQVALSSINITLLEEATPGSATNEWRPLTVVKEAAKQTLSDLTHLIDLVLIFLVRLPLLLITLAFWLGVGWGLWKLARMLYRRLKNGTSSV